MRRVILLAFLALMPAITAFPSAAQTLQVKRTDDGYLNLRDGPGTRHEILGRLSPGDRVDVEETLGLWYRVRLPSGQRGWVSGDYLEQRAATTPRGPLYVERSTEGYLNLRAGPGTDHAILRRIYPGDRLVPLTANGEWIAVRHATGAEGWVHGAYVAR